MIATRLNSQNLTSVIALSLTVTVKILEASSKGESRKSARHSAPSANSQSIPTVPSTGPSVLGSSIMQAAMSTLARSLNDGVFFNTKFIACSRRTTSKRSGATQVVYAQSTVLEAISPNLALDNMAAREDKLFLGDSTTPGERAIEIVEDYEYDSDSDLDDDEDNDNDVEPKATIPPPTVVNTEGEQDASSKSGEDSFGQPGAVTMSVSEEMSPRNECAIGAPEAKNPATSISDLEETHIQNQYSVAAIPIEPPTNIANVVYVKGTAQKTWRALIHYCYTGHVSFLPLKSSRAVSGRISQDEEDLRCSPKSMYRLAHRLDIIALKNTAIAAIEEHLSEANVLAELFSKFTSRYPAVQAVETKVLLKNRAKPEVIEGLPKITRKIFQGQMPHAETVLSDVMQKVFQH
ncbi:hypothetical protein BJ138DRAFT_871042 [Hygrophoropsis aurantiaca]|uniref:Uncharacterized protein n=1 Tax=Hygrophoropsis aurantiaca TaxID=72124 RepID=A0ACB7ZU34_9AGAM|nr:hypothetical protein BJ138DRAFT_871042 [Hygrophoropsis aurantiaca]